VKRKYILEGKRPFGMPRFKLDGNIKTGVTYGVRLWTGINWNEILSSGRLLRTR
jgi:hypothetical protein